MVDEPKGAGRWTIEEMMVLSLRKLSLGLSDSRAMRHAILADMDPPLSEEAPAGFVNNHAWALVRLQAEKLITKHDDGGYRLTSAGRARLVDIVVNSGAALEPIEIGKPLPPWAEATRLRKNYKNKKLWPEIPAELSVADMWGLWAECGGQCSVTGLDFSNDAYGSGAAKRAFAPSLDRIDPAKPYSRENCRFVLVAVNFALNAFGDEVFDRLVLARAGRIPKSVAKRLTAQATG